MRSICVELEPAHENYDTAKQCRLLRDLGTNLKEDDQSRIEVPVLHLICFPCLVNRGC